MRRRGSTASAPSDIPRPTAQARGHDFGALGGRGGVPVGRGFPGPGAASKTYPPDPGSGFPPKPQAVGEGSDSSGQERQSAHPGGKAGPSLLWPVGLYLAVHLALLPHVDMGELG